MFCLLLKSQNETTEVLYEFHTIELGQLAKLRSFEVRMPKVKLRSFKESPHGKHVAQSAARNFYVFPHIFVEIANQKQIFITQPFGDRAMPSVACIVNTLPVLCHRPR